jgi:nitrile hydratase subunit alpha
VSAHPDADVARRVRALEGLLEERGVVDGQQLDATIDGYLAAAQPRNGARLIARAWVDDEFRRRLLEDGTAVVREQGHLMETPVFRVVENTEDVHNVVVCTLCSCYPIALLGPSPSWYRSEAYRSRVVRDPRGVLAEFACELDEDVEVRVWDASAETRYLVLPRRPEGTEGWSEDELAELVTRRGMIGTAAV